MTYPPPHQQPQYPPPAPRYATTTTVTSGGLPVWVHVLYATLGWIPCFLGWIIWPIHWWFAQRKSTTRTYTR